jgi:3-oxoacyl-[acyl-carrier protein] reductase
VNNCLITGGTGSIGSALVKEFAKDCRVCFTYFHDGSAVAAKELELEYGATGVWCDVSKSESVKNLADITNVHFDIVINNAGVSQIKLFTDITDTDWENIIGTNLTGTFNICRQFLPRMISNKRGCIINISSIWGVSGAACEVHYSASKAGVIGLTKALAKETGLSGVRVNAIAPGVIEGGMNAHFTSEEMSELKKLSILNKIGVPKDVAKTARFLSEADFITGEVFSINNQP